MYFNSQLVTRYSQLITPVIIYFLLILNGVIGIDFGNHWDEWFFITQASNSIINGNLLPAMYDWPSFGFYVVLSAESVYKILFNVENVLTLNTDHNFRMFLRVIFLMISSLTVFWVYLVSLKESKSYVTALIAGLLILSSFEFSYHSRWIVTDCIAAQFTFLSAAVLFLRLDRSEKIALSSVFAGIAMGTKYTAAISVLNIIFFILLNLKFNKQHLSRLLKELILFVTVFSISFIMTTPGSVLDYDTFMKDIIIKKEMYSSDHIGHTVQPGWEHFKMISEYIMFELFSQNQMISFLIFLLIIPGFVWALFKKKWMLSGLFITMIIYVIYISGYGVMIVRNLLYVFPFFVLFASLGFHCILTIIQNKKIRYIFVSLTLLTLAYSAFTVFSSALTVKNKSLVDLSHELDQYLKQNEDKHFVFSRRVLPMVESHYKNTRPSGDSYLVFFLKELSFAKYTANIRDQFIKVIDIEDININYYPTWIGDDRILIMKYRYATEELLNTAFEEENFAITESGSTNPWILKAKFLPDGIDSSSNGQFNHNRKLKVFVAAPVPPFNFIDSAKSRLDSATMTSKFFLANKPAEDFYLVIRQSNDLESWSKLPKPGSYGDTISYTFINSESRLQGLNEEGDSNLVYIEFKSNTSGKYTMDLNDLVKLNNSDELVRLFKP